MKIVTVVGARPQFVKAAAVSRLLRQTHTEVLVHTGQHYNENMSAVFFEELGIPTPEYHLGIGSGSHGAQTGAMLAAIEKVLIDEKPDWVLVYGDTNSTLAGALAAAKLHFRIIHVEAGLRSFNRDMPEEINRVLTDHISDLLLCPSQTAVDHLASEGIHKGVRLVGDVMYDALLFAQEQAQDRSQILRQLGLAEHNYLLATVHRAENTDNLARITGILSAFHELGTAYHIPVVFPVHPRTRKVLESQALLPDPSSPIQLIEPVGYLDMVRLLGSARLALTDSGGLQKEAYWSGVPCITLREETEWVETVQAGWNSLAGPDPKRILTAAQMLQPNGLRPTFYGDGKAGEKIITALNEASS